MSDKKKFGLVMPKKTTTIKTQISSIFNDESDDEETIKKRPKIPQKKLIQKSSIKSEFDLDPTIYEYDSIYDEMKTKQIKSRGPKEVKKSRYIETLLKAADKKKKEYERRIDRKIQTEREKEGDQYKDKEIFVTSSYKKKLQEKEEEEEKERRENMLNDMMDVTKQKDLSGFYRHFLNQTTGEEKVPLFGERQIKQEVKSDEESISNKIDENVNSVENLDQDSDGIEIDNEDDDSERDFNDVEKSVFKNKKQKSFRKKTIHERERKRKHMKQISDNNTSENIEKSRSPNYSKKYIRKPNTHTNSDSSSNDSEDNETIEESLCTDKMKEKDKSSMGKLNSNKRHDSSSSDDEQSNESSNVENKQTEISKEEKQKNIYAKRTVGDVFAEAQARYFQRMATRNS